MSDITEAKRKLPLPALMLQLGLPEKHTGKNALCPFHDDHNKSFSCYQNDKGEWRWKCHTCNIGADEIDFLQHYEKLSKGDAIKRFLDLAGVERSRPPLGSAFRKVRRLRPLYSAN